QLYTSRRVRKKARRPHLRATAAARNSASHVTFCRGHSSYLCNHRKEMTMTPRLSPFTASPAAMPDKSLIIGGGFAGFWAAVAARRVPGSQARVTLASPEPMLEIRPRLYEARPETLAVDLLPLLRKVNIGFVQGAASGLDPPARTLTPASRACAG